MKQKSTIINKEGVRPLRGMVFNATFNNILVTMEETRGTEENVTTDLSQA